MNVIVTGATSFIGNAVTMALKRAGHQVYAVVRPGSAKREQLPKDGTNMEIIELDLHDLEYLPLKIKESCDMFFHFGWDGAGSENRKIRAVQQANVDHSMKALEVAKKLGCKRFLFSGSQAEYGIHYEKTTEDSICHPISEYGKAKVDFCNKALRQCKEWRKQGEARLEYIHARIYSVYGSKDHAGSLVKTCIQAFLQEQEIVLGTCDQLWNYLYIDDLVEAVLALIFIDDSAPVEGIYNIAGANQATKPLKEYIEELYQICGKRGTCVYGARSDNAEGKAQLFPDISKIYNRVGWAPNISFKEGINKMLRDNCLICNSELNCELLTLEQMPSSAQDIPVKAQMRNDKGITLTLHQCHSCGLVQFNCEPVAYYRDVIRSGGFSTTMVELRKSQYQYLIDKYQLEGKNFIEVGCGQGEFLSVLNTFPVNGYGIEHKEELVAAARAKGLQVWQCFPETKETVLDPLKGRKFDVFLSFNFLEHQPDPKTMLRCIYHNLTEDGMGLITVPSLEYILQHDGYYELIRDHLAYYTFETLAYLLETCGFKVLEQEMINRDTLSMIVKKIPLVPDEKLVPILTENFDLGHLVQSKQLINEEMRTWTANLKQDKKKLAIWGASHQGFTLAATTVLRNEVSYIIDSAPFKQGKIAPASHLPIVAPAYFQQNPVDVILIVAPGYTDEIYIAIKQLFGMEVSVFTLRSNHMEQLR